jgi:hypothetical protein
MSTEHPATDSIGSIDTNQAGEIFSSLFAPEPRDKELPAGHEPAKPDNAQEEGGDAKPLTEEEALAKAAAEEANGSEPAQDDPKDAVKVTVQVDGKAVELTPEEIAEAYKSGLRQADYTRKTTEAAEVRKTADAELARANAEIAAARQDRMAYAQNLQLLGQQLHSVLQQTAQVDLDRLAVENPAEYVKQKHLLDQRQASLQRVQFEQHRINQQNQAEQQRMQQMQQAQQAQAAADHIKQQRDALLAKLPEWKDQAKASAEKASLSKYLEKEGYKADELTNVNDHRTVLLARKAMLYDKLMDRAKASTAKVEKLPMKVERPGTATAPSDGRTAAMQRLEKSGRVEDAAAIFSQMFK